jgi:hypothetical protein
VLHFRGFAPGTQGYMRYAVRGTAGCVRHPTKQQRTAHPAHTLTIARMLHATPRWGFVLPSSLIPPPLCAVDHVPCPEQGHTRLGDLPAAHPIRLCLAFLGLDGPKHGRMGNNGMKPRPWPIYKRALRPDLAAPTGAGLRSLAA